jgi:hypothetical protein
MPSDQPFEPAVKLSTAGQTVALVISSVGNSATINSTGEMLPSIYIANVGSFTAWIRLSVESSTVAASIVSLTDVPILSNTVRLFANPAPGGVAAVAVIGGSGSSGTVYFVPGQGGIS